MAAKRLEALRREVVGFFRTQGYQPKWFNASDLTWQKPIEISVRNSRATTTPPPLVWRLTVKLLTKVWQVIYRMLAKA
jgi:hypothetical protein